jgi:phosphonate C-P lyase system protein PhnH
MYRLPVERDDNCRFSYLLMVLEMFLDQETTHYMIDEDGSSLLDRRLYEKTKSPPVAAEEADFIVAPYGSTQGKVCCAKRGQPEYPDLSATIVYAVDSISPDEKSPLRCSLQGPGIVDDKALPFMEGFDHRELRYLCDVNRDFPLGVEALFVDSIGRMCAITRSTKITIKDM